jgi:alpha-acetolactate decarboxylase
MRTTLPLVALLSLALAFALSGCATNVNPLQDVITQTTVRGRLDATTPCSNLVQRGTFGVGVLNDGAWIMDTGGACLVDSAGRVRPAPADAKVSFAAVTFFETDRAYDVSDMNWEVFKNTMEWKRRSSGRICAFRISGQFNRLTLAGRGERKDVSGVVSGFYYPDYLRGISGAGYDLYFLDAARAVGGPVGDFSIRQARIELDECQALLLNLPEQR